MRAHPAAGRTSPLTPRVTGTPRTPTPTPPPLCPPCPLARPHVPRGWASRVHLVRRHRTFWQVPLTRWLGPFPGMGHGSSGSSIDYLPRQWWEASPSLGFGRPTTHLGAPKAFFELEAVVTPELMVRCQQRTRDCQGTREVPKSRGLPGLPGQQPLAMHPELPRWAAPGCAGSLPVAGARVYPLQDGHTTHTPRAGCVITGDVCVHVSARV